MVGELIYLHPSLTPVLCISQEQPQGPQELLSTLVPPKQGRQHMNLGRGPHTPSCSLWDKQKKTTITSQSQRSTAEAPRRREDGHPLLAGSQGSPGEVPLSLCSINHLLLHIRSCSTRSACSKHSSAGTSRSLSLGSNLDCTQC